MHRLQANEGVRVCILQWDDRTSVAGPLGFIATAGLMGTFDEDTRKFFEGTKVLCKLAFRGSDQQKNVIKSNIGCALRPTPQSNLLPPLRKPAAHARPCVPVSQKGIKAEGSGNTS